MRCALGHRHPPYRVVALSQSPMARSGRRCYHCLECEDLARETTGAGVEEYPDPTSARRAGQRFPCRRCFPATPSQQRIASESASDGWIVRCTCGWTTPVLPFQEAALAMRGHQGHAGFITTRVRGGTVLPG